MKHESESVVALASYSYPRIVSNHSRPLYKAPSPRLSIGRFQHFTIVTEPVERLGEPGDKMILRYAFPISLSLLVLGGLSLAQACSTGGPCEQESEANDSANTDECGGIGCQTDADCTAPISGDNKCCDTSVGHGYCVKCGSGPNSSNPDGG
jgi:hypothetical protein